MNRPLLFLNNLKDPQSFHCAAHEVILCGRPGCGVSPCLTVARFLSLKQTLVLLPPCWGWGVGSVSFRDSPRAAESGPSAYPGVQSLPRAGLDLAEQSHHALTSLTEHILQPDSLHVPEPKHSHSSLLFPLPEIPFLNFHILLAKSILLAKPKVGTSTMFPAARSESILSVSM